MNSYAIINLAEKDKIIDGDELRVHNIPKSPSHIIKSARERAEITIEALAIKADISERYLYRSKNEGKKPSYDVLYRIIRALNVSADIFFYPEKRTVDTEVDYLLRTLCNRDNWALEVIKATAQRPLSTPPLRSNCKTAFSFLAFIAFFISKQFPYNEISQ